MKTNVLRIQPQSPDEQHEQRIRAAYRRWLEGDAQWGELVELIRQRSPEQVKRMEQQRGISC